MPWYATWMHPAPADEPAVRSVLEAFAPNEVRWESWEGSTPLPAEAADGRSTLDLQVEVSGDALLVMRDGVFDGPGCRLGTELRLPVRLALSIDDDGVLASVDGWLDAKDEQESRMYLTRWESTEASFRQDWMDLMTAHEGYFEGTTTWTLGLYGSLDEPVLSIWGHSVGEDGSGHEFPVWRGDLR